MSRRISRILHYSVVHSEDSVDDFGVCIWHLKYFRSHVARKTEFCDQKKHFEAEFVIDESIFLPWPGFLAQALVIRIGVHTDLDSLSHFN